jgi:tetratricopeptide (TPR) repeat protein
VRPGLRPRDDEPSYPEDLNLRELPGPIRAELRGLSERSATVVGSHLLMAGTLIDSDPALAYAHAEAARRRAARLPIVRQVAGEAAYAAGEFAAALNEFRAVRRMTGTNDFLALAADCERGLGRPQAALALVSEGLGLQPSAELYVELKLVQAGSRMDLGQAGEAERVLAVELERPSIPAPLRARLAYAYADLREQRGDESGALEWFSRAARLDADADTDAAERVERLCGLVVEIDMDLLAADDDEEQTEEDEAADVPAEPDDAHSEAGETAAAPVITASVATPPATTTPVTDGHRGIDSAEPISRVEDEDAAADDRLF